MRQLVAVCGAETFFWDEVVRAPAAPPPDTAAPPGVAGAVSEVDLTRRCKGVSQDGMLAFQHAC